MIKFNFSTDKCDPLLYENTSTPLHDACWRGLRDEVQWLIDRFGYDAFHRGLHGWTPLHSASYGGHIEIFQLLIDQHGIDPNEGDDDSVSSLHMASYKGHLPIIHYLVDTCHVPPDQPDNSNNTALLYSAAGGCSDSVEFFISKNCNFSQLNYANSNLSLLACKSGQLALVLKLKASNLFFSDSKDRNGLGILHYACFSNNVELFEYLQKHYQTFTECNYKSLLNYALRYASSAIVEYIIRFPGNETLLANNGYLFLRIASCSFASDDAVTAYSKLHTIQDTSTIISNSSIKQNVNFIKRKERVIMLLSLIKKVSTCPNFDINSTLDSTRDETLLHLSCRIGSMLLIKTLKEYNIAYSLDQEGRSPVHYAAMSGCISALNYFLSQCNFNVNNPDFTGYTPLVYSCISGSINAIQYLINNHKSDPNITDNSGMTSLHQSCRYGHIDITQYLIEVQHCDINVKDNEGRTLVHHAAWSGNLDLLQYLITVQGLSLTAEDKNGNTALHYASLSYKLFLVEVLVAKHQFDPHQANSKGKLPVHYAAETGNIGMLEFYVQSCKCGLMECDENAWNIMHCSSFKGNIHFIKHVINQYPQCIELLWASDNENRIALHFACASGNIELVTFLIGDMKCDVTAIDKFGTTCITYACISGNLDLVKLLVCQYKLEPLAPNNTGYSPLTALAKNGHIHILEWYSQEHNVDIRNFCDNNKCLLAHLAAYDGRLQCLKQLIKYQCDVNATNNTGSTVLHKACEGGHVPVVLYLTSLPQCNIAAKTSNGSTALHITCQYSGSLPILKHLVENYSQQLDLCAANDNRMAPIHLACKKGRLNLVKYIIEHLTSHGDSHLINDFLSNHSNQYDQLPLHLSCQSGNIQLVTFLIDDMKCDVTATDKIGTICMHACFLGNLDLVKLLLERYKLEPLAANNTGYSPLHVAAQTGHIHILDWYIQEYSVDSNSHCDNNKYTLAHSAAYNGELHCLKHLINKYQCDVNATTNTGSTVLHYGCHSGHVPVVLYLTSLPQCNIAAKTSDGSTVLHITCQYSGSLPILKHLVENHSQQLDLCAANDNGMAPIHLACKKGRLNLVKYIIEHLTSHGDNHLINNFLNNHSNQYDQLLLHLSCKSGNIQLVTFLIDDMKCDVTATDTDGATCVIHACTSGNLELLKLLIQKYKLEPLALRDISPLHSSALAGHIHILEWYIQEYSVDIINCSDSNVNSKNRLAHLAAHYGHLHYLKQLIVKYQCDINATTTDNGICSTILHKACKGGHIPVVLYLTSLPQCNVAAKTSNGLTVLHITSQYSGSLPILKHLVENHSQQLDLCAMDDDRMAPIHYACKDGRLNLVHYIIEHSSSLDLPNRDGCTPFLTAVQYNQLEVIQYLINKKCNLSASNDKGFSSIHISVAKGHLDVLKYLTDNCCNPNTTDHQYRTPLHVAVLARKFEILKYLLCKIVPSVIQLRKAKYLLDISQDIANPLCVNVQDKDGNTPLHLACKTGQHKMVSLLLSHPYSANVLITNKIGQTPLHLAVEADQKSSVDALLSSVTGHQDLLTARDNEGYTVFHVTCKKHYLDAFHYFCNIYPQGINIMDSKKRSLIHTACEGWNIKIVKELVEKHGLDPALQDKDGVTCFHILAKKKGIGINSFQMNRINIDMYKYLRCHIHSSPLPKDKSGRTPLHYACRCGNVSVARYLIETIPCSPSDPDYNGYTSVHAACEAGNMTLVHYFLMYLKCNADTKTKNSKSLLYFASKSCNLMLVQFLVQQFNLIPCPHDIKVAQSVNPDSSVVKYLQNVCSVDIVVEQKKMTKESYHKKPVLEQQIIDPKIHEVL